MLHQPIRSEYSPVSVGDRFLRQAVTVKCCFDAKTRQYCGTTHDYSGKIEFFSFRKLKYFLPTHSVRQFEFIFALVACDSVDKNSVSVEIHE